MGLQLKPRSVRFALFVIFLLSLTVILFLRASVIWSVLQIFIIAGLIALALEWAVEWQVSHRIPRWAATLNLLILLALATGLLLYFLIPPLVEQFQQFVAALPALWVQALDRWSDLLRRFPQVEQALNLSNLIPNLLRGASTWAQTARTIFATAVGAATGTILVFVIVFYTLLNPRPLLSGLRGLFPTAWWGTIDHLAACAAARIRGWVVGILVLGIIIGVLDYLALLLINLFSPVDIPFILFFAMLGGALEVIPVVGPIIAAVLPALVGFSLNPVLGLLVLAAFFFIQQLENHLIVPQVMHRAVELHPVSLIFALLLLSALFGIFGAIIAVPVASVVKVLYDEWYYPLLHDEEMKG